MIILYVLLLFLHEAKILIHKTGHFLRDYIFLRDIKIKV